MMGKNPKLMIDLYYEEAKVFIGNEMCFIIFTSNFFFVIKKKNVY